MNNPVVINLSVIESLSFGATYWAASESGGVAWYRSLYYSDPKVKRNVISKSYGFSAICVQG